MEKTSQQSFMERLDEHHEWPCPYMFKFIVPQGSEDEITGLFPEDCVRLRASKTGKYVSVTAEVTMTCSIDVVRVYEKVAEIEGVISL